MSERQFYDRHYGGGLTVGATPLETFAREMLVPGKRYGLVHESLNRNPPLGGCLAEVGCGGGEALLILASRYRFDRVIGVDIALHTAHGDNAASVIEFSDGNLNETWPLCDAEVDHLVAMMVIEHLFNPFHAFSEIRRCLSRDGSAYVNLPLVTSVRNRMRLALGKLPVTSTDYDSWWERREWDGNHLHYFSIGAINDLARACDLRMTDVRGVGRFHWLKSRLPKLAAGEITFRLQRVV